MYTGNDDQIVIDLISVCDVKTPGGQVRLGLVGGLLGHWACWTRRAVDLLETCRRWREAETMPTAALTLAARVTDANAALFDAANGFAGCIAGIHEILRRQGLLASARCLDPHETLSPGQAVAIDRVCADYPELTDDSFVREHLNDWLER